MNVKYGPRILKGTRKYIDGYKDNYPSLAGLSLHLDVNKSSIYRWRKNTMISMT